MAETAGHKRKDRSLYGRLLESYQADRVSIFIDFDRLNAPRSPVFSPWENVAPLLIILLLAMAVMLLIDLLIGTLAMLLGVISYLFLVRPWVSQRVHRRAIYAAPDNLHNWNILWKLGGLVLTLNYSLRHAVDHLTETGGHLVRGIFQKWILTVQTLMQSLKRPRQMVPLKTLFVTTTLICKSLG